MRIADIQVIRFRTTSRTYPTKYGYYYWGDEHPVVSSITKIITDDGLEGYNLGGDPAVIEHVVKPLLVGENPLNREKLWHWMAQHPGFSEGLAGFIDCALWDLYGRMVDLPVHKALGGCRDRIKAYASTWPNMGKPEDYAAHAVAMKAKGYKAYKVHAYIYFNPYTWEHAPQLPGFPKADVEVCRAVREAVGPDMVLMLDPFGVYTLQESIWVGHELEKLGFYWLEHPMIETRTEAYRRLCDELDIAICSPEHVHGGIFSRAEWVLQGASDMSRIDVGYGGITGSYKHAMLCQAYGIQCEMHGGHWTNSHILGATPESTCEYFEHGLLRPDLDYDVPPPYLKAIPDPLDDDGNVILTTKPGLGMEFIWDYINDNLVTA
ncbi:MAG: enolase [Chloroflexi bacterium]|nr:enolase [Chloroflexota bacterium]